MHLKKTFIAVALTIAVFSAGAASASDPMNSKGAMMHHMSKHDMTMHKKIMMKKKMMMKKNSGM